MSGSGLYLRFITEIFGRWWWHGQLGRRWQFEVSAKLEGKYAADVAFLRIRIEERSERRRGS